MRAKLHFCEKFDHLCFEIFHFGHKIQLTVLSDTLGNLA